MNLFVLDNDPVKCAKWAVDKHVHKIRMEAMQLMSTALYLVTGEGIRGGPKPTHENTPLPKWCAYSFDNFCWTMDYYMALCDEHRYRMQFDKKQSWEHLLPGIAARAGRALPRKELSPFVAAMPEHARIGNAILSYRNYYATMKTHLHKWTRRSIPPWL